MHERLRFLSFNIRGCRNLRGRRTLHQLNALMERLNIDIGVFQEMETRTSRGGSADDIGILSGASRPYHLAGPSLIDDSGWYGNLIVSRYPIVRGLVHNLETKADMEPRNAVDGLIATPNGKFRVIGTHLSLSFIERFSEARNLLKLIRGVEEAEVNPLFLMGDINEWQWPSKLLSYLNSAMTPLTCKSTFPSFLPFLKLDRAWYDAPNLKVYAHRLADRKSRLLSDHLPLLIEVDYAAK